MTKMEKTLKYYRRLNYTLFAEPVVDSDGDRYWMAEYVELPGCKTDGKTEAEAIISLHELFDDYVSIRIEEKYEIPEPVLLPSQPIEEIVIFKKSTPEQVSSSDTEGTQQTQGETKPENVAKTYEEIAA